MGCFSSTVRKQFAGYEDPIVLASQTACKFFNFFSRTLLKLVSLQFTFLGGVYVLLIFVSISQPSDCIGINTDKHINPCKVCRDVHFPLNLL